MYSNHTHNYAMVVLVTVRIVVRTMDANNNS